MTSLEGLDLLVFHQALSGDLGDFTLQLLLESKKFLLSLGQLCQFGSELAIKKNQIGLQFLELLLLLKIALALLLAEIGPELNFLLFQRESCLCLLGFLPGL